jgi:hypothetical protein
MRRVLCLCVAVSLVFVTAPPVQSQSTNQLLQGTQLKLVLLNGLSTSVARDGDPFAAVVTEPVYMGGQLVLPAGVRVNGEVAMVEKSKRFSMFRGGASMNLVFKSIVMDSREIPAQMSIISIHQTSNPDSAGKRKDLRVEEGQVVEAKRDIKGDVTTVGLGGGGGTILGAIFGGVVRGLTLGLVGGSVYIVAKKGKEVELPAQTGLLVRLDNTITLPTTAASSEAYRPNNPY